MPEPKYAAAVPDSDRVIDLMVNKGLHVLNTTIIPSTTPSGLWRVDDISNEGAKHLLSCAVQCENDGGGWGLKSHIGHQGTSDAIAALWGRINVDRTPWDGTGVGLALQMRGRVQEGAILTKEQMDEVGYDWRLIYRVNEQEALDQALRHRAKAEVAQAAEAVKRGELA